MTLGTDASAGAYGGLADEWEDPTLPTGARGDGGRRTPLARGTVPPQGQEEPASPDDLNALRDALVDAGCTALDTVMRVMRWEIDELEAFARETGVSPGDLFQPGLVRGVLDIKQGPAGLAALALDGVGAAVNERLVAAGARSIRPLSRAFAGLDAVVDQALSELAIAARGVREGVSRRQVLELHAWAVAEKRHAAAIQPVPGRLSNALLALWVVKSCDGPARPRAGVDEASWRSACQRLFGVAQVPPVLMARLQLEAMWIAMGLAVNGAIDWPAGSAGCGAAVFTYAANPRALAASLEGHSREGDRYRHLAAGGGFELRFRFTVREPGEAGAALVDIQYQLAVALETPAALTR